MRDATAHAQDNFAKVSDEERAARFEACQGCPLFDGTICTHKNCGCPMRKVQAFLDALSWRSKKCPLDKWPKESNK